MASRRQIKDGLGLCDERIQYWLYVVDRTDTPDPRVFPLHWTVEPKLSLGFFAHVWRRTAQRAAVVTEAGLIELDDEAPEGAE